MSTKLTPFRLLVVSLFAAVALTACNALAESEDKAQDLADDKARRETLAELETRALQDAVKRLMKPEPLDERQRSQVAQEKISGFGWRQIDFASLAGFDAKHFPSKSFIETNCTLTKEEWSRATYVVDRKSGEARQLQSWNIDGLVQDEALFLALVREGRIALHKEDDVVTFVYWARLIMESPHAFFGPCGNSKFGSEVTKVDGGWKFVTTVDRLPDLAWKISCDAEGIVTDVDRNLRRLPARRTREQNRAAGMAELKRCEDAKAWWVEQGKKADLATLVAKSDLVGVATDFTSCSGTGRLYRVFTFVQPSE